MLALALILAFGLELVALFAFGLWGVHFGQNALTQVLFGLGTPLLVAVFWGVFLSPKASAKLPPLLRLALKCVIFALATAALVGTEHPIPGTGFGMLAVLVTGALYIRPRHIRPQLEAFHNALN